MPDRFDSPDPYRGPYSALSHEELKAAYERSADNPDDANSPLLLAELQHRGFRLFSEGDKTRRSLSGLPRVALNTHMKTVDAVDSEIRFTAHWGGKDRYVFIPDPFVSNDAGWRVTREEAIAYVQEHLERYRAEARAQHGEDNPEKIIILKRGAEDSPDAV